MSLHCFCRSCRSCSWRVASTCLRSCCCLECQFVAQNHWWHVSACLCLQPVISRQNAARIKLEAFSPSARFSFKASCDGCIGSIDIWSSWSLHSLQVQAISKKGNGKTAFIIPVSSRMLSHVVTPVPSQGSTWFQGQLEETPKHKWQ